MIMLSQSFFHTTYLRSSGAPRLLLNSLISYWNFDEASGLAHDSVSDNDGTVTNATQNATGKLNKCISFDGTGDKIDFGNDSNIDVGLTDWAFSAWIKTSAILTSSSNIYSIYNDGLNNGDYGISIMLRGSTTYNGIFTRIFNGATYVDYKPATNQSALISDGEWHHIVISLDRSANIDFYIDNTNVGSTDITNRAALDIISSSNHIMGLISSSYSFNGLIDEVGIWKRALTTDDVAELYNSGNAISYPFN